MFRDIFKRLAVCTLLIAATMLVGGILAVALAQDVVIQPSDGIATQLCADDGFLLKWLFRGLYTIGGAAILANIKTLQRIPVLGVLLNFVGANWASWLRQAASQARKSAVALVLALTLAGALALAACVPTGNLTADAATAKANMDNLNAAAVVVLPDSYKLGCAAVSVNHGTFIAVAPALLASGKIDQTAIDTEKTIFTGAEARCTNPPADLTGAGEALLADAASIAVLTATKK